MLTIFKVTPLVEEDEIGLDTGLGTTSDGNSYPTELQNNLQEGIGI